MVPNYQPPVANLLNYVSCHDIPLNVDEWPDYLTEFGLTEADIPELCRLMQDDLLLTLDWEEPPEDFDPNLDPELATWAPIHAWRALGQLRTVEFLEPAIAVLEKHSIDWSWEEFPDIFGRIGPPILEPLGEAIVAAAESDEVSTTLIDGIKVIGKQHPESRDRAVHWLTETLKTFADNHIVVNAALITALVNLKATESAAVIEAAYQAERVDEFFAGTWPQVQVDLGLKSKDDFTQEELTPEAPEHIRRIREYMEQLERMNKPLASEQGLPLDFDKVDRDKPPSFTDMLGRRSPDESADESAPKKGFAVGKSSSKKGKKQKKR